MSKEPMPSGMATFVNSAETLLGLNVAPAELTFVQMSARAFLVFIWGVFIVRWGDRRLLGRNAGFDMILVVILGSVLSRGINGQAAFFPTLGVSGVLIFCHHLMAHLASRSDAVSKLIKGSPRYLIREGIVQEGELRRCRITDEDLEEALRLNGNIAVPKNVREARLERNGSVSVVKENS